MWKITKARVGIHLPVAIKSCRKHSDASLESPVNSDPWCSGIPVVSIVVLESIAMTGACLVSGITGVLIPLTLRRLGADPAVASSIFLTTATDVVSMGMFLWLANVLVL